MISMHHVKCKICRYAKEWWKRRRQGRKMFIDHMDQLVHKAIYGELYQKTAVRMSVKSARKSYQYLKQGLFTLNFHFFSVTTILALCFTGRSQCPIFFRCSYWRYRLWDDGERVQRGVCQVSDGARDLWPHRNSSQSGYRKTIPLYIIVYWKSQHTMFF
jgi:hypothetical protein